MIFILLGISVGFPWNALLSSTDYYNEQVETSSLSTLEAGLTLTYVSTNLLTFIWLNRPKQERDDRHLELTYIRIYFIVNLVTFLVLTVSPWLPQKISTNHGLFTAVIIVGGSLGGTSAVYQHACFAIAARINESKTRDFIFGFAAAGTLASMFTLATRTVANPKFTAFLNFGITELSLLIGLLAFVWQTNHTMIRVEDDSSNDFSSDSNLELQNQAAPFNKRKLIISLVVIGMIMFGTLLVFPALVASLKPVSFGQDPKEFTSILFLLFNVGDLTGRGLSIRLRNHSDTFLLICTVLRTCLLSLFFICNRNDTVQGSSTKVSDSFVYALVLFHGVAAGILFSAAAARAPLALVDDPGKAGKLSAATIALSLALGALVGSVVVELLHV